MISRRPTERHNRGLVSSGVSWTPLSFGSSLYAWYRADLGVTLNGGDVAAWADQSGNGRDWVQGTAANQALYVASDSRFGGNPSIEFNGTSDFYPGSGVAADWKLMNDGLGSGLMAAIHCPATTGSRVLVDSCAVTGANVGFAILLNNTADNVLVQVAAGGGVNAIVTSAIALADGATHLLSWGYQESASPEYEFRVDRAASASGNSAAPPTNGNPLGVLTLGRGTSGTFFLRAAVAELIIVNKRPTTSEMQSAELYMAGRYGL